MEIELGDGTDGPSLIIDGVRIPFQMEAHVTYGPADGGDDDDWSDWDDDAPWMITLPVEVQVMLPYEILYPPAPPRPALPTQEHADPHPGPEPAAWGPGAIPLPRIPDRDEPVTLRALQSLRLDETLGQRAGGWSGGLPELAGLVFPEAPDAGDPADAADDWHPPATGTGPTGGTTGYGAVDAVFAAGRIETLDRVLRPSAAPVAAADTGGGRASLQPAVDHHAVTMKPSDGAAPDSLHSEPDQALANPVIPVVSRRSSSVLVPSPVPFDLIPSDREADAVVRQLTTLLGELRERIGTATGDALKVIEGDIQAVNDELLWLEHRGQLKDNTLRLLSQVYPHLKKSLNNDSEEDKDTRLQVHHTIPYKDHRAEPARTVLRRWGLSIHDPADAAIVPRRFHYGPDVHGMADRPYSTMVVTLLRTADRRATEVAARSGREAGRRVILDAIRTLSDDLVSRSSDERAIDYEKALRTLERPLPRPDLASPYDWKGYGP